MQFYLCLDFTWTKNHNSDLFSVCHNADVILLTGLKQSSHCKTVLEKCSDIEYIINYAEVLVVIRVYEYVFSPFRQRLNYALKQAKNNSF
jgi:hypothetical protein